jgi:AcrR family transcriptional regulator
MPRIAEATRAARREQIITAGLASFARTGYHATTMADVAARRPARSRRRSPRMSRRNRRPAGC